MLTMEVPNEVWSFVLSRLEDPRDWARLQIVSKQFQALVQQTCWPRLTRLEVDCSQYLLSLSDLIQLPGVKVSPAMDNMAKRSSCKLIGHIKIQCNDIALISMGTDMASLFAKATHVTIVHLDLAKFTSLNRLNMSPFHHLHLDVLPCHRLKKLHLWMSSFDENSLFDLAELIKNASRTLTQLNLIWKEAVDNDSVCDESLITISAEALSEGFRACLQLESVTLIPFWQTFSTAAGNRFTKAFHEDLLANKKNLKIVDISYFGTELGGITIPPVESFLARGLFQSGAKLEICSLWSLDSLPCFIPPYEELLHAVEDWQHTPHPLSSLKQLYIDEFQFISLSNALFSICPALEMICIFNCSDLLMEDLAEKIAFYLDKFGVPGGEEKKLEIFPGSDRFGFGSHLQRLEPLVIGQVPLVTIQNGEEKQQKVKFDHSKGRKFNMRIFCKDKAVVKVGYKI